MAEANAGAVNPTSEPDPRFDPANDLENEIAHEWGEEPGEAEDYHAEDVQDLVRSALERALSHYEENIAPAQVEATDYYMGRLFGDEQDGRSKVVSTDVRDATHAQIPSLLRIFFSPERAVEFRPRNPNDEATARQKTEYVNYILTEDNPGLLIFDSWFKDALVRKVGWVKWWWEEKNRVDATNYSGLGEQELLTLTQDPDVQDWSITGIVQGAEGATFDVRVTRQDSEGMARYDCIPPEEIVYTPNARSIDQAALVAHVREVPREDLVALGIDEDLIDEAQGQVRRTAISEMEDARQQVTTWTRNEDDALDDSQKPVLFAEAYMLADCDGDGIAELRLFQCVGPQFEIANGDGLGEIVDEIPFAPLTPHPEPHTIAGLSNYDLLKDVQRVKSQIIRGTLDSLAQTLEPVTEVVEGQVNMSDLLSPDAAKIVRVRAPGQMREVSHMFVGPSTLPVLGYFDELKEARTGHSKASAGLDADSLQSSTKAAVAATLSASQQRIEYIARIFAETGVKRLFKGLLRLVVKHQNKARMIRLRDQFVPIDPRHWDATMDVSVNVALGQGSPEDRIQTLAAIIGTQKEAMAAGAPIVSWVEIRNSLAKAIELAGFKNPDQFFKPWGPEQQAQMDQQMAQQPPQPDPNMMLVQIEGQKAQHSAQIDERKLQLEQWKAEREDDREREKLARDAALREYEMELKHNREIDDAAMQAKVAADRASMDNAA